MVTVLGRIISEAFKYIYSVITAETDSHVVCNKWAQRSVGIHLEVLHYAPHYIVCQLWRGVIMKRPHFSILKVYKDGIFKRLSNKGTARRHDLSLTETSFGQVAVNKWVLRTCTCLMG
jgi:hypothetical protein